MPTSALRLPLAAATFVALAAATGSLGCNVSNLQLQTRAASDLKCERSAVTLHTIGEHTYAATGCGRQARYVEICEIASPALNVRSDCRWVRNDDDGEDDAPETPKKKRPAAPRDDDADE